MPILHPLKDDDEASQLLASVEGIGSLLGRSSAVDAGAFRYTGENILGKYCSTLGHSSQCMPKTACHVRTLLHASAPLCGSDKEIYPGSYQLPK